MTRACPVNGVGWGRPRRRHDRVWPRASGQHRPGTVRLHDLRHTHATLLLRAGVPPHVVAARLGHADASITLRVYAHVLGDQALTARKVPANPEGRQGGVDTRSHPRARRRQLRGRPLVSKAVSNEGRQQRGQNR